MHLWDRLLPQTEMTLNMLQVTNTTPYVSAHAYMHGQHDYNYMPLAPLGCHAMTHNKPDTRTSWAQRASEGIYGGTSAEHYQCFKIWMKDTKSICISDTVTFKHKHFTTPTLTPEDAVTTTATNLSQALKTTKFIQISETTQQALQQISDIFTNVVKSRHQTQSTNTGSRVNLPTHQQLTTPEGTTPPMRVQHAAPPQEHQLQGCSILPSHRNTTTPQGMVDTTSAIVSQQLISTTLLSQETQTMGPAANMQSKT